MSDASWENLSQQAAMVAGILYFLALLSHLVEWSSLRGGGIDPQAAEGRPAMFRRLGVMLTVIGFGAHFVSLLGRGMAADPNRVPWGNMYEFAMAGSFFVVLIYLACYRRFRLSWIAPWVLLFVIAAMMTAEIWLYKPIAPLTEALDSYWLVIHVVSAVIATGGFSIGGIISILYLVKERKSKKGTLKTTGYLATRVPDLKTLDRISYRMHAFAFPVWTFAVLITGPIWAHEAWSRYWNWDPKEVWAFITWVVYAAYLHARTTAGWKGRNSCYIALVGLFTLWYSFIGVNFFNSNSQHSYAESGAETSLVQIDAPRGDIGAASTSVLP